MSSSTKNVSISATALTGFKRESTGIIFLESCLVNSKFEILLSLLGVGIKLFCTAAVRDKYNSNKKC